MTDTDVVLSVIALAACAFAAIPAALTWQNLKIFRTSQQAEYSEPVSVLVPARNEEQVVDGFIRSVLASQGVEIELVVLEKFCRFLLQVTGTSLLSTATGITAAWDGSIRSPTILSGKYFTSSAIIAFIWHVC